MVRPLGSDSVSEDGPPKRLLLERSPLPGPLFEAVFAGGDAGLLGFGVGAEEEDLDCGCGLSVGCFGASCAMSTSIAPSIPATTYGWCCVGSGLGGRDWTTDGTGVGLGEVGVFTNEAVCCGTGCRFAWCVYDIVDAFVVIGCGGSIRL